MLETILQDFVSQVETIYKKDVFCHIGNSANIVMELTKLRKENAKRFPLFAFMRPFKVKDNGDHYDITIRRVAIATITIEKDYELEKIRQNFDPELRPLNELFKQVLTEDKRVITGVKGMDYTTEDMPYFNSGIEPDSGEKMDGIIIDNLNIKLNKSKINCNLNCI